MYDVHCYVQIFIIEIRTIFYDNKICNSKLRVIYTCTFIFLKVRVSQDQEHFLLHPYGLQYHEITASSLLKIDMQGNIIDPGTTNYSFNRSGFTLHSALHAARPDLKCIIQVHHPPCVAVSIFKVFAQFRC